MNSQSSSTFPVIVETEFDLNDRERLADFLGPHIVKTEAEFQKYATDHFHTDYSKIDFQPFSVKTILDELRVNPSLEGYKEPYLDYQVEISDDNCINNLNLSFAVIPGSLATRSACVSFFPILLFICILEFYKTISPGDQIVGNFEFSWGQRKRILTGKWVLTIIFRFQLQDGSWQFYDYSSEYPELYKFYKFYKGIYEENVQYLNNLRMDA